MQAYDLGTLSQDNFEYIKSLVYQAAGLNIPDHKQQLVHNRITSRLKKTNATFQSFDHYIDFLSSEDGQDEIVNLINALTTNVTHFFREKHHFDHMEVELKAMAAQGVKKMRIWSAACSIGAESYSAAIAAQNALKNLHSYDVKVLGTDIDTVALERARAGVYEQRFLKGLSDTQVKAYFDQDEQSGDRYKIKPAFREISFYNYMNFNDADWPMSGPFDFIFCRNVLIYFDAQKQQEYLNKLTKLIRPGGFIYLGHSENMAMQSPEFEVCGPTVYRKKT